MENRTIGIEKKEYGVSRLVIEERDIHIHVHKSTLKSALDEFLKDYFDISVFYSWCFNCIALFLTLLTTKFQDTFGVPSHIWQALFVIADVGIFVWIVIRLHKVWKNKNLSSACFVESLQNSLVNTTYENKE